jgi:hypothetical protein
MPKVISTHEVDNIAHWLASPKREEVFSGVAKNICAFVHPTDPNKVGLTMEIADMGAFEAILHSEAGAAAMKHDGVRPETVVVLIES